MESVKSRITEAAPVPDPSGGAYGPWLCPLVQYGSQMIIEAEYRDPDYDIRTLLPMLSGAHPDISAHFTGDDRRLAHGQGVFP